jgi:hypothetical protein
MTKLIEKAFEEASKLSPDEQDRFAAWLLEELASEERWQDAFAKSEDKLIQLGEEALAEHRAGKTEVLDPDNL